MAIAANQYASKVYSEHPIALWPLDEEVYYLSLIDDSDRLFTNYSNNGVDRVNLISNPSFETAATGWNTTGAGTTIARITTDGYFGSSCLQVTKGAVTSSGALQTVTGILPSTQYTFSAYVKIPTGQETGTIRAQIDWSDGVSYISASVGTGLSLSSANGWTRIYVTGTAPSNAKQGNFDIIQTNAGTAGQTFLVDGVLLEQSSSVGTYFDGSYGGGAWIGAASTSKSVIHVKNRVNEVSNPSLETNATGWNGLNVTSAVRSTAQFQNGTASFLVTANGSSVSGASYTNGASRIAVTAGKTYTWSVYVRDATAARGWNAAMEFYNASTGGTLVSIVGGIASTSTLNAWVRYQVTAIAPAGATHVTPTIYSTATMAAASQVYFDTALFEESVTAYPYFDGAQTSISYGGTAYTISPTWSGTAHASTSTLIQWTASNSPTIPDAPSPFSDDVYSSVTKATALAGIVEVQSPDLFGGIDLDFADDTFTVNTFLYQNPTYINWFKIGYRYTNVTQQEVLSAEIPAPDAQGWINLNQTFTLPTTYTGSIKVFIQVNFMDSTAGDTASRTIIMNGLSVGQGSSLTCYESLGSTAIDLPSELGFPATKGIPADQYGMITNNGYYMVKNNALLAHNDAMSMIYGTDHCTKIEASGTTLPSFIFPGKGMLHENGRANDYTFEMWMKIDPQTSESKKIVGPLDSNDGVYVKEGFISLVIDGQVGSHYVGEWYRPMLMHITLKENNATMMINGEEVVNIEYPRATATLSDGNDWWGIFSQNSTRFFTVDCISIYPYVVSNAVAKRRFIYGQGTPSIQSLDASYAGTPTTIDFATSEYGSNVIYPDAYRWDAGYFNNLNATRDYISVPDYSLPVINIGGRDLNQWYEDNYSVNLLEDPNGDYPKFITLRPNVGFKSDEKEFNDATVNMDDAAINIDGYTAGVEYGWYPQGTNYQEKAYLNFPSLSVLNDRVAAAYGIFEIESSIASDRTLMSFSNTSNGDTFDIKINGDEASYYINSTLLYSEVVPIGTGFLVGVGIDSVSTTYGYEVSKFFSSPSSIQLYIGGNGVNTFEGKIYLVGLSNDNDYSTITDNFYNTNSIGGGIAKPENYQILTDHIASYTLVPEYEYGKFFLDISVSSEWEEFYPLSYFASYVNDENGNSVYDLDMLQLNISYASVQSTGVWNYEDLKAEFPVPNDYADLAASVYNASYFNLKKKNTTGTSVSVSNSSLQGYVTFQKISEGANRPLSSFQYSKLIDESRIIFADAENTALLPEKVYETRFSFVDDMIIFPPKTNPFEEYAMVVHLEVSQRSILRNPLKIKKMEITAKNFNENSLDGDFKKTPIGTKFGKYVYPYIQQLNSFNGKGKKPFTISKETTPYLYNSSKSGVGIRNEAYQNAVPVSDTQVFIPINSSGSLNYFVSAMQFMIKPSFTETQDTIKMFEVVHKGGNLVFSANKNSTSGSVASYTVTGNGYLVDGGQPSTITHVDVFDGGTPLSSYSTEVDFDGGTAQMDAITDISYLSNASVSYFQNGRYVPSPILNNNEWSVIGIVPNEAWDFEGFTEGGIILYGGARFNNISYYLAEGLGLQSELSTRVWQDVLDANIVGSTQWLYWDGNTWQNVYILGQTSSYVVTPIDIYDAYVGTNGSIVDDTYGISITQGQTKLISDASWSVISGKPV